MSCQVLQKVSSGISVIIPSKHRLSSALFIDELEGELEILFPRAVSTYNLDGKRITTLRNSGRTYISNTEQRACGQNAVDWLGKLGDEDSLRTAIFTFGRVQRLACRQRYVGYSRLLKSTTDGPERLAPGGPGGVGEIDDLGRAIEGIMCKMRRADAEYAHPYGGGCR